jgi:hypothetical protein
MHNEEFESRVLRFEKAWSLESAPEIAGHLRDLSSPAGLERHRLLIELIAIDIEYRWRNSGSIERFALEHYVERFPELVSLDRLPLELIGEEYRARRRWGNRPSHADVLLRFHERRQEIGAELLRIDEEIQADLESITAQTVQQHSHQARDAEFDPGVPLVSHRDFLLRRLIGAGRMGKVYEARPFNGAPLIAVKFLRKSLLQHPQAVRRFVAEARMVALLRHPQIVGIQGHGRTPGGSYFIVMDLVAGPNLAHRAAQRVIALDEAIRWGIEICAGLGHAHERGIVHCDLKPANLLIDASGTVRITDFGLARSLVDDALWAADIEGTAPFMAPEQVSPYWGSIDCRTDVYGVGAVLFTLLTGRPPFVGRRIPDVLAEVASAAPVVSPASLRPGLTEAFAALCRKCLAKEPSQRFQTAQEVGSALGDLRRL